MSASPSVPLNHQYLLEALHAASSTSQELVQQASAQLKEWEKQPGYWALLQVGCVLPLTASLYFLQRHALTALDLPTNRMPFSTVPYPSSCVGLPSSP